MSHSPLRNYAARLGRLGRRLRHACTQQQPRPSLPEEMAQSALIGFFACTILTFLLAAGRLSASLLIFGSALGFFLGGVIGIVLWISSAELPEEPVLSPAPGQDRPPRRRSET